MIGLIVYFIIGVVLLLVCYRYTDEMKAASEDEVVFYWVLLLFLWPLVLTVMFFLGLHNWLLGLRKV